MGMQASTVTTQDTEPSAREMTLAEKLERLAEIAKECTGSAECLDAKLFGAHPVPCEDVSPPHDASVEGVVSHLTALQCRLKDLLANIARRL